MKKNAPSGGPGRGAEELTEQWLEIINNVQSESDNILFANREAASRHVVRSITCQAVVPAHLGTSDHIFPERIIDCTRQSEQLAIMAGGRRRVPESIAGASVLRASIELQLLGCLIHQVKRPDVGVVSLCRKSVRVIVGQPDLQVCAGRRRGRAHVETRLMAGRWTAHDSTVGS